MPATNVRRKSRELALQVEFQREFVSDVDVKTSLEYFKKSFSAPMEVWSYAEELLQGIYQHKEEIDNLIQSHSSNWKMERMAMVDRNLLRIAVFEICFSQGQIPPNAAINEAIEIAKKYGTTESAAFLNGILDEIAKGCVS
ncbi:MAG: transcription antitermination factor NusB [Pseudobdellovibrionaceae bacterium]|nr:transcription antitermination factor NusB [Bdellovibrionales bacterium]USN48832.1 MAG: transcription antitermination factor NusB [Pseudobdellovibrionaceae bacterium]